MQKTAWQNHKMGRRRRPPCPLTLTASTKCSYTQSHCTFSFSCTSVKFCCIVTVQCWYNCLQRLCLSRHFLKYLKLPLWSQGSDFCCDDMDRHADWLRRWKTILAVLSQLVIIWIGNKGSFVVFLLFYQLSVEWFPMQEKGGAGINDAAVTGRSDAG